MGPPYDGVMSLARRVVGYAEPAGSGAWEGPLGEDQEREQVGPGPCVPDRGLREVPDPAQQVDRGQPAEAREAQHRQGL